MGSIVSNKIFGQLLVCLSGVGLFFTSWNCFFFAVCFFFSMMLLVFDLLLQNVIVLTLTSYLLLSFLFR